MSWSFTNGILSWMYEIGSIITQREWYMIRDKRDAVFINLGNKKVYLLESKKYSMMNLLKRLEYIVRSALFCKYYL